MPSSATPRRKTSPLWNEPPPNLREKPCVFRTKEQDCDREVKDAQLELTSLAPRAVQRGLRALDELLDTDLKHLKT